MSASALVSRRRPKREIFRVHVSLCIRRETGRPSIVGGGGECALGSNFFCLCWFAGAAWLYRDLGNEKLTIPGGDFYDRADYGMPWTPLSSFDVPSFFFTLTLKIFSTYLVTAPPTQSIL